MRSPHVLTLRVYYEDTDFSGYVYHASYLKFFERGRTEFLRELGFSQAALKRDEAGLVFVVGRLTVDFRRPAAMDDWLTVTTRPLEVRGPLVRFKQSIERDAVELTSADVLVVAVRDGRPARLPAEWKNRFMPLLSE